MKRSVAIVGPTPSFVRWAIRLACPLRQIDVENLPDATFRQLRSLRELSYARIENRIFHGICYHRSLVDDAATALGFFEDEVGDFFGGQSQISKCCDNCCANAVEISRKNSHDGPKVWAGCYGWLPSTFEQFNYVREFQSASSNWFLTWQCKRWIASSLDDLLRVLTDVHRAAAGDSNLGELAAAAQTCIANQMVLETELVPGGHSDGLHWTINSHCPDCKFEMADVARKCPECGKTGAPNRATKRKVLGLRPYGLLKHLIGEEKTRQQLCGYKIMRQRFAENNV